MPNERILVVIPAHNEAPRIGPVVRSARAVLPQADVAVIDDASTDDTERAARDAGATVLVHVVNLGYGAALETGYLFAQRHNYDVLLQMDGDGQHLAEELPALLAPVLSGEADLVLGSRYAAGGGACATTPARRLGQRLFAGIVRLATRQRISDPTSGFQCLGRRALQLFSSGIIPYDFPDADVLMMAHYAGLRVREAPARMHPRSGGTTMHAGLRPVYYVAKMLLSIFLVALSFRKWKAYVQ